MRWRPETGYIHPNTGDQSSIFEQKSENIFNRHWPGSALEKLSEQNIDVARLKTA